MDFKPISHFQRCNDHSLHRKHKELFQPTEKRLFVVDEYDEASGRVIRKSEFRTIDRVKEMENYRCIDFSLENMLSSGVSIQACKLSSSNFAMLDNLETQVEKISNSIKQSQSNNE